ncbi:hypothetical protein [Nocardia sp. NPDC052566]|uniref:hypothetical protein n=1 Tax=Nocardia sp. NPDC052566 TaxID=3364330 RepID=UPI0037CBDF10
MFSTSSPRRILARAAVAGVIAAVPVSASVITASAAPAPSEGIALEQAQDVSDNGDGFDSARRFGHDFNDPMNPNSMLNPNNPMNPNSWLNPNNPASPHHRHRHHPYPQPQPWQRTLPPGTFGSS